LHVDGSTAIDDVTIESEKFAMIGEALELNDGTLVPPV